jgi:protocatechuate 3,4-dioxygenase beta subunit
MSVCRRVLSVILLFYCAVFFAQGVRGQDSKKESQLRTVHGIVLDKSENPVSESVVYLKNDRTNVVRTLYTDNSGKYRFSGLDPNADYEIYAQKDDSKSATHTVTSFDSRKDVSLTLRIDRKKD